MRVILVSTVLMFYSLASDAGAGLTTTNALQFYIVSKQPIPGGRFINTSNFPSLGYISNAPSFVLARLSEVRTNDVTSIHHMVDTGEITTNTTPAVSIAMFPDDARRFADFTRQNVEATVVVFWRDQPLMAPRIVVEIESGRIELAWERRRFPQEVIQGIQALLRRE